MSRKDKLAVYISSYDGCQDLWDIFFEIFDTYWKDCPYPIYLVNNEKEFIHSKAVVLHTGPEVNWFSRTIKSLELMQEEFVVFLLEDYFLSKKIDNSIIEEIIMFMKENDVYFYRLSKSDVKSNEKIRHTIDSSEKYPISLQPAVWNRKNLIELLKEINKSTPWEFEKYIADKYRGTSGVLSGVYYDVRDILGYKNGVLRGKWFPSTLEFYKKRGIVIDTGNREVLPFKTVVKYNIACWVSRTFSVRVKSSIKRILKSMHFDYVR